jgi:hypothetical protein
MVSTVLTGSLKPTLRNLTSPNYATPPVKPNEVLLIVSMYILLKFGSY